MRCRKYLSGIIALTTTLTHSQAYLRNKPVDGDVDPVPKATTVAPIFRSSGSHHIKLYIGTPPQWQTLIIDTGSHFVSFPCEPCLSCALHSNAHYDPELSSTTSVIGCNNCAWENSECSSGVCQTRQRYTEGSSWIANEVEDRVWVGDENTTRSIESHERMSVPFVFGCQIAETGLFRTQFADGILGMAMHPSSIMLSFLRNGSISYDAFSLCLGVEGGTLALGGSVQSHFHEPMQFTPFIERHGMYSITVEALFIGSEQIKVGMRGFRTGKGTIIDSGTTDTYLPESIRAPFEKAWETVTGTPYTNQRKSFRYDEFHALPDITLVLSGGYRWVLRPHNYFEESETIRPLQGRMKEMLFNYGEEWTGLRDFTNRIYTDEPKGAVLGINAMLEHDIYFDTEKKRIGIARSDCGYTSEKGLL